VHSLLKLDRLQMRFGGVVALDDVSFDIPAGQICGLLGPNGAGKTTLINCISRLQTLQAGEILFDGQSILSKPAHALAALGIARSFQNLALFNSMSVRDHVLVGTDVGNRAGWIAHALGLPAVRRAERAAYDRADQLLQSLGLHEFAHRAVGELSLGMRRRVELGRALGAAPRLLLLDEPASGLTTSEADSLAQTILMLRERYATTVLMIEHRMRLVTAVCDHVVVLNFGCKIAEGTPAEIRRDPQVVDAWLGARS
jgi:branched-chain amino acid transport system ATP-binding protein